MTHERCLKCEYKKIKLSEYLEVIVDADDYSYLNKLNWIPEKRKGRIYATTSYFIGYKKRGRIYIHRFITNAARNEVVDHINGNGLDNRKSNLRICSNRENVINRHSIKKSGSSKYIGVYWSIQRKKWIAQINLFGKSINIGGYNTEKTAALVRNIYALKYYGPLTPLNSIF